MPDLAPIRRALLSVSDKQGLVELARFLVGRNVELISTGGTARTLREAGLPVISIDDLTGFPEIMDGRVKTLHPKVHGGLLFVRDNPDHVAQAAAHAIKPIDLVCVNLYPFESTIEKSGVTHEEAIEQIDIGGPSMLRSAAKNFEHVTVLTRPAQYERLIADMTASKGSTTRALRAELAQEVFATTSRYDAAIASYLARQADSAFPPLLGMAFVKAEDLRYGENPHQRAALYRGLRRESSPAFQEPSIARAEQLHGKELSYNNILDAAAALSLALALGRADPSRPGAVVVKHTNPCGAAIAASAFDAVDLAIAGDPLAAYGGILALNTPFTEAAAARLNTKEVFLEVIIAPSFEAAALAALCARWSNVRLLAVGDPPADAHSTQPSHAATPTLIEYRSIPGGLLAQERDLRLASAAETRHAAGPAPTPGTIALASFLEAVVRSLTSNAVCIGAAVPGRDGPAMRLLGAGAGQMDRLTSSRLAVEKAQASLRGPIKGLNAVAASDAFFPFPDGPELLIQAGITTIVHPGGSKRDQDTLDLCNQHQVTCLLNGLRHFRH